jgi:hypothetical protein
MYIPAERRGFPMKLQVQLGVCTDAGHVAQVQEIAVLEKDDPWVEPLGLALAEAKQFLHTRQHDLGTQQTFTCVIAHAQCDHGGATLQRQGQHTRTFRTLFGTVTLPSPRLYYCRCQPQTTTTFRPLSAILTEPRAPELLFMEMKSDLPEGSCDVT